MPDLLKAKHIFSSLQVILFQFPECILEHYLICKYVDVVAADAEYSISSLF